jgi:hypothetical protein
LRKLKPRRLIGFFYQVQEYGFYDVSWYALSDRAAVQSLSDRLLESIIHTTSQFLGVHSQWVFNQDFVLSRFKPDFWKDVIKLSLHSGADSLFKVSGLLKLGELMRRIDDDSLTWYLELLAQFDEDNPAYLDPLIKSADISSDSWFEFISRLINGQKFEMVRYLLEQKTNLNFLSEDQRDFISQDILKQIPVDKRLFWLGLTESLKMTPRRIGHNPLTRYGISRKPPQIRNDLYSKRLSFSRYHRGLLKPFHVL